LQLAAGDAFPDHDDGEARHLSGCQDRDGLSRTHAGIGPHQVDHLGEGRSHRVEPRPGRHFLSGANGASSEHERYVRRPNLTD
jgi:hypothetical protein